MRTLRLGVILCAALLAATAKTGARCYWQPPVGWSPAERAAALQAVLPYLASLHVYHWRDAAERRPLAEGAEEWQSYLAAVAAHCHIPCWALLEFVCHDDPKQLAADADILIRLLAQTTVTT